MRSVKIGAGAIAGAATAALPAAEALAQEALDEPSSIDAALASFLGPIADFLTSIVFYEIPIAGTSAGWIILWLGIALVYVTLYLGFINFRAISFSQFFKIMRGRYSDPSSPGEVSQAQAMFTALSGTIGIGNIAGVGIAIAWGGPGATFWMIIIGLCAMSVKFAECTLGVKYRETHADGTVSGGPMYYLKHGLANRGYAKLGIALSVLYVAFGIPTILQWATVNQMFVQVNSTTGFDQAWIFGVGLAVVSGAVILGGIQSIARVTVRLVPTMATIYLIAALSIVLFNITAIPGAFVLIFEGAFAPDAVSGGILGAIIVGMRRAIYSTEAGLGTSSMAHSAARTREPVSEGMVGMMEPLIDTVIVSTITALVIIISGQHVLRFEGVEGIALTSAAFTSVFPWFDWVLMVAVLLFGFSTVISWAYYTEKIWTYVLGDSRRVVHGFRIIFCILLIPGGVLTPAQVFDIIDSLFFLLALPNIIGLYLMMPEVKADLKDYLARLKSGEITETNAVAAAAAAA